MKKESSLKVYHILFFLGLIFTLVGSMFLLITIGFELVNEERTENCIEETTATCSGFERHTNTSTSSTSRHDTVSYAPVFEYYVDGKLHIYVHNVSSNTLFYEEGDIVTMLYNPDNPDEAYILGDTSGELFTILFRVIGGGFMIVGAFFFVCTAKTRSSEKKNKQDSPFEPFD